MFAALPDALRDLGDVEIVAPLHPSRPREVALVRIGDERYVLKSKKPPKQRARQIAQRLFGHPEIANEAHVYAALEKQPHPGLAVPRLVFTDRQSFLMLEYVEGRPPALDVPESRAAVVAALVAFQQCRVGAMGWQLRQPRGLLFSVHRFAGMLGGVVAGRTRRRVLPALWRLAAAQPRLKQPLLVHHDLNRGNVLVGGDGRVYLLDFAAAMPSRRWVFQDIVMLASGTKGEPSGLHASVVAEYTAALRRALPQAGLRPDVQLRAALLNKTLHRILFAKWKRRSPEAPVAFLESVLLDDAGYQAWYRGFAQENAAG